MGKKSDDTFPPDEAQRRFEAALRGARIAGHKSKDEVSRTLGKPETKPTKAKKKKKPGK
jgi:hypothetical protein